MVELVEYRLDEHFNNVVKRSKSTDPLRVRIKESKLQDWIEALLSDIVAVEELSKTIQPISKLQTLSNVSVYPMPSAQKVTIQETLTGKEVFLEAQTNRLIFHEAVSGACQNMEFPPNSVYKNCSVDPISENQFILIGGCIEFNKNIKSCRILRYEHENKTLQHLSSLPYGISSHASVFDPQNSHIYLIGGMRDLSVMTKGCFRYHLHENFVEQISCLNYPTASATAIIWKKKWIYKFGGIGESLTSSQASPFIEKYSIAEDYWEIVNPLFNEKIFEVQSCFLQKGYLSLNVRILIGSLILKCSSENQIFIMGGFDEDGRASDAGFVIKVPDNDSALESQIGNQQQHQIVKFGIMKGLKKGGFFGNQCIKGKNQKGKIKIFALQTQYEQKPERLQTNVVEIC